MDTTTGSSINYSDSSSTLLAGISSTGFDSAYLEANSDVADSAYFRDRAFEHFFYYLWFKRGLRYNDLLNHNQPIALITSIDISGS